MRPALIAAACLLVAGTAEAAGPLPPNGQPIATSRYKVDLFQGPVLASTRVIGLAGAYVAIAEGIEGNAINPAAPAVRVPWSYDHFDYDLGFGITFPGTLESNDFFNTGSTTRLKQQQGEVFVDLGANLQFGRWGFGLNLGAQQYALTDETVPDERGMRAEFGVVHVIGAHAFGDGQLLLGGGVRVTSLDVTDPEAPPDQQSRFHVQGAGPEVGALWRPNEMPFRIGAAFHSAITPAADPDQEALRTNGDIIVDLPSGSHYMPRDVTLPWDLAFGFAIQLGPKPFNPRWLDPDLLMERVERFLAWRKRERERERRAVMREAEKEGRDVDMARAAIDARHSIEAALDDETRAHAEKKVGRLLRERYLDSERFYLLVSSQLLVIGDSSDAVGVESFVSGTVNRAGTVATYSPRLGLESEIVPRWMKARIGTYGEPTRFETGSDRLHGTVGFDLKLFPWTVFGIYEKGTEWRVSGALDAAPRYFGWSASLGVWH